MRLEPELGFQGDLGTSCTRESYQSSLQVSLNALALMHVTSLRNELPQRNHAHWIVCEVAHAVHHHHLSILWVQMVPLALALVCTLEIRYRTVWHITLPLGDGLVFQAMQRLPHGTSCECFRMKILRRACSLYFGSIRRELPQIAMRGSCCDTTQAQGIAGTHRRSRNHI